MLTHKNPTSQPELYYGCFRGSTKLPDLGYITEKYDLRKKQRIQCRKQPIPVDKTPSTNQTKAEQFLSLIFKNEKKIERKIRSKSRLDSLFELCPMSPWRETSCLKTSADIQKNEIIQNLDFTNFYPSVLINNKFPDPKDLWHTYPKTIPTEPGLLRAILHIKSTAPEQIKQHHPFQLQIEKISCPFYIEGSIETLIHTNEIKIWEEFFEIEPIEAIISPTAINHPLKNRVICSLEEIKELKRDPERNHYKIDELKLIINSSTTTPKINQKKDLPSQYGVHCFSSQIVSNARATLFNTIHNLLRKNPTIKILQINTDGFIIKSDSPKKAQTTFEEMGIWGDSPGQIRQKCDAQSGLFLGANTWWLLNSDRQLVDEAGTGRDKSHIKSFKTIPKYLEYTDKTNTLQRINLLYLSDFRHKLNHTTLERRKFVLSQEGIFTEDAPWQITHREKTRSWIVTKKTMNKFIKDFKKLEGEGEHRKA